MRKQTVIIMEGPDGCAKTTIGKALSNRISVPYFKVNSEHNNWRLGQFKNALCFDQPYIQQFLKQTCYNTIIDRAYPSEKVYSTIFDRDTDDEVLEQLDEDFSELGAIIILCRRDWAHGYDNVADDLVKTVGELRDLDQEYEKFKDWTKCNIISIFVDRFEEDIEEQLRALTRQIDIIQKNNLIGYKFTV